MVENSQPDLPGARPQAAVFEYSRPAFHAIQETVLDDDRKFPRGGEEGAGVLYGTREGNIVRVQVARRIACEHARGRGLILSANDRAALKEQLTREATEPALQGLAVVGWFLSHAAPFRTVMTASGKTLLSPADLQTFDQYFGTPGQVTLVLRPHASTPMQASVFTRRADGSVNAEDSDLDFLFTEPAAFPDGAAGVELEHAQSSAPAVREIALAATAATMATTGPVPTARQTVPTRILATSLSAEAASLVPPAPPETTTPAKSTFPARENTFAPAKQAQPRISVPKQAADPPASTKPAAPDMPSAPLAAAGGPDLLPAIGVASLPDLKPYPNFGSYSDPTPRFTFEFTRFFEGLWSIVGLVLLAGVASMPLGVRYYRSRSESVPISLTISESDSQILVRWNHSSRVIREAVQGSIEILDGKQSRSAILSGDDLSHGNVSYIRQTGDVQIRLEVEDAKGQKTQEVVRFVESHPIVGPKQTPVTADSADALRSETTPGMISKVPPGEQTPATVKASDEKTAPGSSSGGPSGTYLQLEATSKFEAEIIVDGLRQKRFDSLAVEIPGKAGMYRVLVGPMRDGNVNKLRADLQNAGFPGNGAFIRIF